MNGNQSADHHLDHPAGVFIRFFQHAVIGLLFVQQREYNCHKDLPLLSRTGFEPFMDGLVQDLRSVGNFFRLKKMIAGQFPVERVVLKDGKAVGLHHAVFGIIVHQHAHDGVRRNVGPDQRLNMPVPFRGNGFIIQARAIKGKDHQQTILNRSLRLRGSINGKVASLAVSGQIHGARGVLCRFFQVIQRCCLGRNGRHIAHHEIFLPAHHRRIGAAKGDHNANARHIQRHR